MNRSVATPPVDFASALVECTHCGKSMTPHFVDGSRVRYFQCPACLRWLSSSYSEVLRADTKFRVVSAEEQADRERQFSEVKDRLERWLSALDDQDPYRVLGVSPQDSSETVRRRYRELAFERHPDRGGSGAAMGEVNVAYERILSHRARRQSDRGERALPARAR